MPGDYSQEGAHRGAGLRIDDAPASFGQNVRRIRRKQRLSLETLATLSGVSRAMLGQIETGKSVPTITVGWKIAKALSISFAELFDRSEPVSPAVLRTSDVQIIAKNGGKLLQRIYAFPKCERPFVLSEITISAGHSEECTTFLAGRQATLVVTAGSLEVRNGDCGEAILLDTGDAILLESKAAHRIANPGAIQAKAFLGTFIPKNGNY